MKKVNKYIKTFDKFDTFLNWLSNKLQVKIGDKIGNGTEGVVFELPNRRVIKITTTKVAELYKIINKNHKGIAKIYQIGWIYPPKRFTTNNLWSTKSHRDSIMIGDMSIDMKLSKNPKLGYIIMEKVDTSVRSEISDLMYMLYRFIFFRKDDINKMPEVFIEIFNRYNEINYFGSMDTLTVIYKFIIKNEAQFRKFISSTNIEFPNILYEILDLLSSIKNIYPNWEDIHAGQFGRNMKGELVVFDIGDDDDERIENLPTPKNIIKEIFDYKIVDFDDISDEYKGYVYLYTTNPIELDDIKSDYISVSLSNRADASSTDSEYIYRIKTKKPLYKKKKNISFFGDFGDFGDFDDNPINDEDYSGYVYRSNITGDIMGNINTKDIVSFKHIGGFVKYDKHISNKLDIKLSEETESWLYSYISGSLRVPKLTTTIIEELKPFKPKNKLRIYKGIEKVQIKYYSEDKPPYKKGQIITSDFTNSTSWSTNVLVARRFIDDYPSSTPYVISMEIDPKDILVDVEMLPKRYYHANQREIIVLPGIYTYKIIWESI